MNREEKKQKLAEKLSEIQYQYVADVISLADEYDYDRERLLCYSVALVTNTIPSIDFEEWKNE